MQRAVADRRDAGAGAGGVGSPRKEIPLPCGRLVPPACRLPSTQASRRVEYNRRGSHSHSCDSGLFPGHIRNFRF